MKRFYILFLLLCFIPALTPLRAREKKDSPLTVISYNIRLGEADDGTNSWKYRLPASSMMIEDQKPDIFGLQEAYIYQVRYLEEYVKGYKSVGVGREDGKKEGEHMSIFYNTKRIKLLKWGTFWLSETPDKPSKGWDAACRRTATWALLKDKASGRKFYYVNTHLDHIGKEARAKGLSLILDRIKDINPDGLPMVLTGDLNVTPDDPCLRNLDLRMKSARDVATSTDRSGTFHGWGRLKEPEIIDYIYYSGFRSCTKFSVVKQPYDNRTFISDHYPVKAELIF